MLTNADLMTIFKYTEDDLAANRTGRMSARQAERLKRENEDTTLYGVVGILGIALVGCCALFAGPSPRTGAESNPGLTCLVGIVIIGFLVITLFWLLRRTESDLKQGQVASIQGNIQYSTSGYGFRRTYLLEIDSRQLFLSHKGYYALKKYRADDLRQRICRVYYSPRAKRVLALEIL